MLSCTTIPECDMYLAIKTRNSLESYPRRQSAGKHANSSTDSASRSRENRMLVNLRQAYTLTNHRRSVQRREEVGKEIILARERDGKEKEQGRERGR
jgi:hypothetical protein